MLNSIPVIGWILDIIFKASLAVPFWIVWTACGVGEKYFNFLPDQFHSPGFMATIGIFICLGRAFHPSMSTAVQLRQSRSGNNEKPSRPPSARCELCSQSFIMVGGKWTDYEQSPSPASVAHDRENARHVKRLDAVLTRWLKEMIAFNGGDGFSMYLRQSMRLAETVATRWSGHGQKITLPRLNRLTSSSVEWLQGDRNGHLPEKRRD